ncbi:hypothetical protein K438DRAFT_1977683 [Mycena galopus ATCC 62051]|nr:hypothetical protein K438DRAFT_1977683 [Mycena galopus ATCC 62051]
MMYSSVHKRSQEMVLTSSNAILTLWTRIEHPSLTISVTFREVDSTDISVKVDGEAADVIRHSREIRIEIPGKFQLMLERFPNLNKRNLRFENRDYYVRTIDVGKEYRIITSNGVDKDSITLITRREQGVKICAATSSTDLAAELPGILLTTLLCVGWDVPNSCHQG